jgi:leader peptidase (prepilin peptidase)/N-methyltransferase
MYAALFLSFIIGWLVGGLCNWLADELPHASQGSLNIFRLSLPIDRQHFLRSLATPWRPQVDTRIGESFSWRGLLLPVGMATAFAVGWLVFAGDLGWLIVGWFYTAWLLLVLVIDFEHRRVLNVMLPPAIVVALLAPVLTALQWANLPTVNSALLGGGAGFLVFALIFVIGRGRMMGAGDVKLAGVIGLMVGYPMVWPALMLGILLGGLAAIFLIIRSRSAKSYMAYGPYLALGALIVLWSPWF